MSNFIKISDLSSEDRSKLKGYWSELWGKEFAHALVTDYELGGDKIKVKASNKKMNKKAAFGEVENYENYEDKGSKFLETPEGAELKRVLFDLLQKFDPTTVDHLVTDAIDEIGKQTQEYDIPGFNEYKI